MTEVPLLGAKALRAVLERHGVRPSKALGQNFVIDPNTIRKVLSIALVDERDEVIEIGPGAGSLTLGLAANAGSVVGLEVDERLIPVLEEVLRDVDNVRIVQGDALTTDLSTLPGSKLVANLPYNIATPVVIRVLEEEPQIEELTVMTQREVGERLAAAPGSKVYGAPSVIARLFADVKVVGTISRQAFYPIPNVDSVIVRLRRTSVAEGHPPSVGRVVAAAFGQRRKTLTNALQVFAGSKERAEAALVAAGIDPGTRAEQVEPQAYARLASLLD